MSISALLSPQRIFIDAEITSKKKLLEFIARVVAEQTQTTTESCLFNGLLERERLGSTGLGRGFAVPHARMAGLDKTLGCFFRLRQAVNFEAPDNMPVDLVFSIVIPQQGTDEHLMILSSLASIFSRTEICDAIRTAESAAEVNNIIRTAEA